MPGPGPDLHRVNPAGVQIPWEGVPRSPTHRVNFYTRGEVIRFTGSTPLFPLGDPTLGGLYTGEDNFRGGDSTPRCSVVVLWRMDGKGVERGLFVNDIHVLSCFSRL